MTLTAHRPAPTTGDHDPALAIDVRGLVKRYGEIEAVRGIDVRVRPGRITGFVGPNGAGKTTTIRMLLGLVAPSAGSGAVLGAPISRPAAYLDRVGALIEGPAFTPALTGYENLLVLARLDGSEARIPGVLDAVGLTGREHERVAGYSLGMRQRLGIAAALLPDPELLILDEPTNGLDPAGIREIRALLRGLSDAGRTVFVSSHLLAELELVCDDLVVVSEGRVIFAGAMSELLAAQTPLLILRPQDPAQREPLARLVRERGWPASADAGHVAVSAPESAAAQLNRAALEAGIDLRELRAETPDLETTFFALTGAPDGEG